MKIFFTLWSRISTKSPILGILISLLLVCFPNLVIADQISLESTNYSLFETFIRWFSGMVGIAATVVGIYYTKKKFELETKKLDFEIQKYEREQWKEKQHIYLILRQIAGFIALGNFEIDSENGKKDWMDLVNSWHQTRVFFKDDVITYLGNFYWKVDEYLTSKGDTKRRMEVMQWFNEQIGNIKVGSKGFGPLDEVFRPYMGLGKS